LDPYNANSLKQHFVGRHITPLQHINQILSQPVCFYSLAEKQQIPISLWFDPTEARTCDLPHSRPEPVIYRTQGQHTDHITTLM